MPAVLTAVRTVRTQHRPEADTSPPTIRWWSVCRPPALQDSRE